MNLLAQLIQRIAALEARLENILQYAKVTAVDEANNLLDVSVRGVPLTAVPYLTMRAGEKGQTYWVPEVGELGMLLSPSGHVGNAVFLPGQNYKDRIAPESDPNKVIRQFDKDVKEEWDGNDNAHMLSIGGNATRKTEKAGKIEDKTGTAALTLEQSGAAKLAATEQVKLELTAILANLVGAHLFPTGITTLQSPVGPVMFAPAPSPTSPPSPPAGSEPDSDGNVTKTPASTISGVKVKSGSSLRFTLQSIPVTTPAGPGATVATVVTISPTGNVTLEFPARSL